MIQNIDALQKVLLHLPKYNSKNNTQLSFQNPIQIYQYQVDKHDIISRKYKDIIQRSLYPSEVSYALSCYYFGNYFNISYPSIGPLYHPFEHISNYNSSFKNDNTIFHMMIDILNGTNDFMDKIPLIHLNIYKTLSRLLFSDKTKKKNIQFQMNQNISRLNESIFENENIRLRSIIENHIQGIRFTLDDVMKEDPKKETSRVKMYYLLPFDYINGNIEKIKDFSLIDRTNSKNVLQHNRKIITKLMNNQTELQNKFKDNPMLEINCKNCLAIYTYISITLFYDIYKYYMDNISKIVDDLVQDDRFKKLDIEYVYEYIEKCYQSLFSFKKILENSFYHLFLPSRLTPRYGVTYHKDKGYFEIENKLLTKFSDMILYFPFHIVEKQSNQRTPQGEVILKYEVSKNNPDLFINFVLTHKNNVDIFSNETKLYFGCFIDSYPKTFQYLQYFNEYMKCLYTQAKLNEVIYKILNKSFQNGLPIEIFTPQIQFLETNQFKLRNSSYSTSFVEDIQKYIYDPYEFILRKMSNSLIQLGELRKNTELYKNKHKHPEIKINEYSFDSFTLFQSISIFTVFVEQFVLNNEFRKQLLQTMKIIRKKYESFVIQKTKNIQKNILNQRNRLKVRN